MRVDLQINSYINSHEDIFGEPPSVVVVDFKCLISNLGKIRGIKLFKCFNLLYCGEVQCGFAWLTKKKRKR